MSLIRKELTTLKQKNKRLMELVKNKQNTEVQDNEIIKLQEIIDEMIKNMVKKTLEKDELDKQIEFLIKTMEHLKFHNERLHNKVVFFEKLLEKTDKLISTRKNYISEGDTTESEEEIIRQSPKSCVNVGTNLVNLD